MRPRSAGPGRSLLLVFLLCALCRPVASAPPEADVIVPRAEAAPDTLQLSGSVEARQVARLAPLESGVVADFFVEAGDRVNAGDLLLQLDDTLVRLELAQAEAALDAAALTVAEAERLLTETRGLSERQLVASTVNAERKAAVDLARSETARLQAAVDLASERVNRYRLRAPFAGVIAQRTVSVGEWVSQQTPVFSLVESSRLRVNVAVPQEYLAAFRDVSRIEATVSQPGVRQAVVRAPVSRIVRVFDARSRVFTALIDLPRDTGFLPGMSADVLLTLPGTQSEFVWLPRSAVKRHPDGGASVFSIEDGIARRHVVRILRSDEDRVAVLDLADGKAYVVSGVEVLEEGQSVIIRSTTRP